MKIAQFPVKSATGAFSRLTAITVMIPKRPKLILRNTEMKQRVSTPQKHSMMAAKKNGVTPQVSFTSTFYLDGMRGQTKYAYPQACTEDYNEKDGVDYRGCQSRADTGGKCVSWDLFPSFGISGHNYCRNPNAERKQKNVVYRKIRDRRRILPTILRKLNSMQCYDRRYEDLYLRR